MRKILLPTLLSTLLGVGELKAQDSAYLDIGNVKALIYADANLFQNKGDNSASYEVPKGSNAHTIYASSLWMSSMEGQRNGKDLVAAAYDRFGQDQLFSVGPVDIVNQRGDTSAQFQRLWKINKSEIDQHLQNWNTPGYTAPAAIIDWPGNGNANTANTLAPFADLDNDKLYEPLDGEYPLIKGDQATFLMVNDYRPDDSSVVEIQGINTTIAYTKAMKMEMHLMLYAYNSTNMAVANTVFAHAKIFNRSTSANDDLHDLKLSVYTDFDIGNPSDDYVGTDTAKHLFYAYNGDAFDESVRGNSGYGGHLAAQGVQFLDRPLDHSVYYNIGSGENGDPLVDSHVASYQRNLWKNGQPFYYGGNAYNFCVDTSIQTSFMFVGDPSIPLDSNQWTETNPCLSPNSTANPPGDRRMIGGPAVPSQLLHGESVEFNYAYIFAQSLNITSNIADPVQLLAVAADSVQSFYQNTITVSLQEVENKSFDFALYPNPASNSVRLDLDLNNFEVAVFNLAAKRILSFNNEKELDISALSKGIYFVQVSSKDVRITKKLVVVD
jgi:hypothetical protein